MAISPFSLLIQDVVIHDAESIRTLARLAGKSSSTLLREANPYDSGAKLGVDTLMRIMEATGDVRPLQYMAESLGYSLEKMSQGKAGFSGGRHALP